MCPGFRLPYWAMLHRGQQRHVSIAAGRGHLHKAAVLRHCRQGVGPPVRALPGRAALRDRLPEEHPQRRVCRSVSARGLSPVSPGRVSVSLVSVCRSVSARGLSAQCHPGVSVCHSCQCVGQCQPGVCQLSVTRACQCVTRVSVSVSVSQRSVSSVSPGRVGDPVPVATLYPP